MSGIMTVTKENGLLCLDFPSRPVAAFRNIKFFEKAFGIAPVAVYKAEDFLVLFDNEEMIESIKPDFAVLKSVKDEAGLNTDGFGIIITAKGTDCDFV